MIAQQIQQLNKHDFMEYIHQLQLLAKEKFSFDIFIENRLSQNNKFEKQTNKKIWKNKGKIKLNDNLEPSNIREIIYDDEFYKHIISE